MTAHDFYVQQAIEGRAVLRWYRVFQELTPEWWICRIGGRLILCRDRRERPHACPDVTIDAYPAIRFVAPEEKLTQDRKGWRLALGHHAPQEETV